jgi:hypothetical protein
MLGKGGQDVDGQAGGKAVAAHPERLSREHCADHVR